jgi:hypothetical protein
MTATNQPTVESLGFLSHIHHPVNLTQSDTKGYGLISQGFISKDQIVFEEESWLSASYLITKRFFLTCSHCQRHMESARTTLSRISGLRKTEIDSRIPDMPVTGVCCESCSPLYRQLVEVDGPDTDGLGDPLPSLYSSLTVPEVYCSEACRQAAWDLYHRGICPGNRTDPALALQCARDMRALEGYWMKVHPPPETATITLLIKIVGWFKTQLEAGHSIEQLTSVLNGFQHVGGDGMAVDWGMWFRDEETQEKQFETLHKLFADALYDRALDFCKCIV